MRKLIVAATSVAVLAVPAAAHANVNADANGVGFVGKGDVQTALGYNNPLMQANASKLSFTFEQKYTQSADQSATQAGTQDGTQSVHRQVSCTITKDNKAQHLVFDNDGFRNGTREGSRSGDRTGSRSGVINGTIASAIDWDARKANQINGFLMNGIKAGTSTDTPGPVVWDNNGAYSYGEYNFGDWQFGPENMDEHAVEWTGWVKGDDSDGQPTDCLRTDQPNGVTVTELMDNWTYGSATEGTTHDGAVTEDAVEYGPTTPQSGTLSVTGPDGKTGVNKTVALPNTPVA